jgi:hypothetical protein
MKRKDSLWIYLAIGSVGSIGQAMWLRHNLIDTYPYKMMGRLSDQYTQIGNLGVVIAPALSIAAIFIFPSAKRFLFPAVTMLICPIIFWIVFEYIMWRSPSQGLGMLVPHFDRITGASVWLLFVKMVVSLSGVGMLIGVISGGLVSLIDRLLRK